MTEWISCKERLPENGKYLVFFNKDISTARFWNSQFYMDNDREDDAHITHWAELPPTPKDE